MPGVVMYVCGRSIASSSYIARPCIKQQQKTQNKNRWVWWGIPVISATQEAETRRIMSLRAAWKSQ
jgi:hypothetical protein